MFKFLAILVVAAAAAATAYNLSGDLESSKDDFPLHRQRRGTKRDITKEICCDDGTTELNYNEEPLVKQCSLEIKKKFPDATIENLPNYPQNAIKRKVAVCEAECIFRAYNLTENNCELNRETISTFFNHNGAVWKKKLVDSCWDLVHGNQQGKVEGCSRLSFDIARCILGGSLVDCPSEYRVDTNVCFFERDMIKYVNEDYFIDQFVKIFRNHTTVECI